VLVNGVGLVGFWILTHQFGGASGSCKGSGIKCSEKEIWLGSECHVGEKAGQVRLLMGWDCNFFLQCFGLVVLMWLRLRIVVVISVQRLLYLPDAD
jgi:hypothetical protein